MFVLVVAGGPDKGKIYELTGDDPVTLGRGGNLVRLSDRKASRHHARLEHDEDGWRLVDLGSRHGTYYNHQLLEQSTLLRVGDVVQIGKTVLVVSSAGSGERERDVLLGMPLTAGVPVAGSARWTRAAAIAAVLTFGGLVGTQIWQWQIEQGQVARIDAMLQELGASSASVDELVAAWDARRATQLTERLDGMVESFGDQVDRHEANGTSMKALAERMEARDLARGEQWGEMLATAESQLNADVIANRVSRVTLEAVVTELRGLPTQAELADAMRDAASEVGRAQARVLGESIARWVGSDEGLADRIDALERRLAASPTALEATLDRVLVDGESADLDRLYAEVASVKQHVDEALAEKLDHVIAALDAQPSTEGLAAMAAEGEFDDANALAVLASELAKIRSSLASLPSRDSLVQELREVLASVDAADAALLTAMADEMDRASGGDVMADELAGLVEAQVSNGKELSERLTRMEASLDSLVDVDGSSNLSSVQLAHLRVQQEAAGEQLKTLIHEVRRREGLGDVHRQLTDLALLTGANRERLEQLAVKLDDDQIIDRQLASLADRLASWPDASLSQLDGTLAAVRVEGAPGTAALEANLVAALRDEVGRLAMTLPDRDTLAEEVRMAVASATPVLVSTSPDAVASASSIPMQPTTGKPIGRVVLTNPKADSMPRAMTATTNAPKEALSPVEHAYRLAFETGEVGVVGAGEIDTTTGRVSHGRKIDPLAARSAGFKTWRQWYASDMFAERMRAQRAATEHLKVDQDELIRIPGE